MVIQVPFNISTYRSTLVHHNLMSVRSIDQHGDFAERLESDVFWGMLFADGYV